MIAEDRRAGAIKQLLEPGLLARLSGMHITVSRRRNSILVGRHHSLNHGSSIEFAEHKEYTPGDDLRHLDWRAVARLDRLFIKRFEDETNLRCFLLLDCSGSMDYGSGSQNKLAYATQLAAAIAFILLQQQDNVGLLTFRDEADHYIPPRSRSDHLLALTEALIGLEAHGKTHVEHAMHHVLKLGPTRSLIVLISDFFDTSPGFSGALQQLARHHDVALLHVLDPAERTFPFEQVTLFQAMEGPEEVLAEPKVIRSTYLREFARFQDQLRRAALEAGADYTLTPTDQPVDAAIRSWRAGRDGVQEGFEHAV